VDQGRIHTSAAAADVNEVVKAGSVPVPVPAEETMQGEKEGEDEGEGEVLARYTWDDPDEL
jgi:hypothetical protein